MASKEMKAIISIAGTVDASLGKAVSQATKQMGGLGTVLKVTGSALKATGAVAAIGLTTLSAAAIAGTKSLVSLGQSFDAATDAIRIGTGATGEALEALQSDFDEVYKSVPTTMDEAATAIADYNTRLGLTGPALQGISEQAIQVSNMLGDDLTSVIEESSQAFSQWDINAEGMSDAMDYVFKASQSTGVGFTELLSTVQQFGPQLQDMGFSFKEATALVGQLDKAGVNTNEVLAAMKKSVTTMAKDGLSASEGIAKYADEIKNAGTQAEATAIAAELFGTRAGSTMASAIRDGTLAVDDLTASLIASDETILKAAEDTMDFPEKFQLLKQQAKVAFEPLAGQLLDAVNGIMPVIGKAMNEIVPVISEGVGQIMPVIQGALETIGPMISELVQTALPMVKDALSQISPFIQQAVGFATENLPTIMGMLGQVGDFIMAIVGPLAESLMPILQSIFDSIMPILQALVNELLPPLQGIIEGMMPYFQAILGAIQPIFDLVLQLIPYIIQGIGAILEALRPVVEFCYGQVAQAINNIMDIFGPVIEFIKNNLDLLISYITGVFMGNWQQAWESAKTFFANAWSSLSGILKTNMNAVISVVNGAIARLNSLSVTIPAWVPIYGGSTFSLNVPQLGYLAKGGFTEGVSIAGEAGTEAVISFDPSERRNNLGYWAKAGKLLGVNATAVDTLAASAENHTKAGNSITFSPNITIQGNADYDTVLQALRDNEEEFMDMLAEFFGDRKGVSYG